MKETDGLEPQQYQKHYWEDDTPLADVRKNAWRKFIYIGFAIFCLLCLMGALLKFPDQVELPFILKTEKPEETYRFPFAVYVKEKYITPGARVVKGQPIVKITAPEIVVLINDYVAAQQNMSNFGGQKNLSIAQQSEILKTKIRQNTIKIAELKNALAIQDNTWASNRERLQFEASTSEKNLEDNKNLYASRYISKVELKEHEEKKIRSMDNFTTAHLHYEKERADLNSLISQYNLEILTLRQELEKLSYDTRYDSLGYESRLKLAEHKIRDIFGDFELSDGALVLKASGNGIVSYLFDGDKEVMESAILMRINYGKNQLYSSIICPPTLIGKINKDNTVFHKVSTFPSYEWGTVKGHVENLSLTYDENGNYNIKILLDDQGALANRLQAGMNGSATIVLEKKTFFQYFFRKVRKAYHAATLESD